MLSNNYSHINFESLNLSDQHLHSLRMSLYHSGGDGFVIFRKFINAEFVTHMRTVWSSNDFPPSYKNFISNNDFYVGCPNYFQRHPDGSTIHFNFLFSPPLDEVTHEVAVFVHMLRNRLSGRNAFDSLASSSALQYRVVTTRNYGEWIAPHRDFMDWENRWKKGSFDPSRLQATLFLSELGKDYDGQGFLFEKNNGEQLHIGKDVLINSGDLIIWRYGNTHSVENVTCNIDQLGLMRIIFPIYQLPPTANISSKNLSNAIYKNWSKTRYYLSRIKRSLFV